MMEEILEGRERWVVLNEIITEQDARQLIRASRGAETVLERFYKRLEESGELEQLPPEQRATIQQNYETISRVRATIRFGSIESRQTVTVSGPATSATSTGGGNLLLIAGVVIGGFVLYQLFFGEPKKSSTSVQPASWINDIG